VTRFGLNEKKLAWLCLLLFVTLMPSGVQASVARLHLFPEQVEVGAFFQGTTVRLKGEVPPGSQVVVEILGTPKEQVLLRKGRRAGLWMTVGEIRVEHAPNLYLVLSSTKEIPSLEGRNAPWGFAALKSRIKFRGALTEPEIDRFFQEFLKLKESEGLYAALPGALSLSNEPQGPVKLEGVFPLPPKVAPGTYEVRLSVIQNGQVVDQKSHLLTVRLVGFPALLASLAFEHGAWYGILAVLIAIATGFLMGFLFKGKAEH